MHSSIGRHNRAGVGLIAVTWTCVFLAACGGDGDSSPQGSQGGGPAPPGVTLRLLAGSAGGSGDIDGTGTAARFNHPYGIAADGAGNLYVTDGSAGGPIRKITPAGIVTTFAGKTSAGSADGTGVEASFSHPTGIRINSAGILFVADTDNSTIREVTSDGVVTTLAGTAGAFGSADGMGAAASFFAPAAVAVDSSGFVYVADTENNEIRKISPQSAVTTLIGSKAGLYGPSGIAVNASGTVYVSNTYDQAIEQITPAGVMTTLTNALYGSCADPGGLIANAAGTIYVAANAAIEEVAPGGAVTTVAGVCQSVGADTAAGLYGARDVAVDATGTMYVTDQFNNRVVKITSAGSMTTVAGAASASGNVDGAGAAALFNSPSAVAADASGNIYVADYRNSAIRMVTPQSVVTTLGVQLAGSPAGIAIGSDNSVYITLLQEVDKISPQGVLTKFAGDVTGSADGTGGAARFNAPSGVALNGAGVLYVADTGNCTLRAITPAAVVTTLAGLAGQCGASVDGFGSAARFQGLTSIAVDSAGNIYVSDTSAHVAQGTNLQVLIRKVTPQGTVTTIVPNGTLGFSIGDGALSCDGAGNLYIADSNNHEIRKVTPEGAISTAVGSIDPYGLAFAPQPATLSSPTALTVLSTGQLVIVDGNALVQTEGL
jgi:sugar lactone lactonase YvrE